jgi:uncharacterized protein (DUF302 family)
MIPYGFTKELEMSFEAVKEAAVRELKKEGFGVLTEIDVQEKLKEKLGVDMGKYVILGACHPPSAHQAILAEENIGLVLPCNVIVFEKGGRTVLSVIKPTVTMEMVNNESLRPLATVIEGKLEKVFRAVGEQKAE